MIEIIEGLPDNVVGIVAKGRVTKQECREVLLPAMKQSLRRHDKIRLYYQLSSRFPGAAWDDLKTGIEDGSPWERVAVVTDVGWIRYTVRALCFLIPGEIRVFATTQAPEGREWITAAPGTPADVGVAASVFARDLAPPRGRGPGR